VILFGLRDIGSINACLPVINILKDKEIPVSVYAEGVASKYLKDKLVFFSECQTDDLLDFTRPSLVVATAANKGGTVPIGLTVEAKQRNLPVVFVEEMWSGHSAFQWKVLPDGVCVMDEFAKSLILRSWPNYPESHIHITGSPVFDKLVSVQTNIDRYYLRKNLGLSEDWPIVFFPGLNPVSGMIQAVPMLVESLNDLGIPVYLVLRDHPTVSFTEAAIYHGFLKNLRIGKVIDSSKLATNEVNAGSDIVVGVFSTMTVEACYLRKPVLTIWTPEIGRLLLEITNNNLTEWPIVNLGASLKAESVGEIKNCLRKIFSGDTATMLDAQQKHFKTDGLSGVRVAKAILSYY